MTPANARRFESDSVPAADSRRASTGRTLVARRAGTMAATTVTSVPTSIETMIVRGSICNEVVGRLKPTTPIRVCKPLPTPIPSATPTAEAPVPIRTASSSRLRLIWRRVAPIARINAISRERWVTIIVKVFQMMKPPTNNAMPAKIVSRMLTILRSASTAFAFSSDTVAPVTASAPSGTTVDRLSTSSAWLTPSSAPTSIVSKTPGVPSTFCAVSMSKYADVLPPRSLSSPKPTVPTTVNSSVGPRNRTLMVEPTSMSFSSALVASITTSCRPSGASPERISTSPRRVSSSARVDPVVGRPPAGMIALPSLSVSSA